MQMNVRPCMFLSADKLSEPIRQVDAAEFLSPIGRFEDLVKTQICGRSVQDDRVMLA